MLVTTGTEAGLVIYSYCVCVKKRAVVISVSISKMGFADKANFLRSNHTYNKCHVLNIKIQINSMRM